MKTLRNSVSINGEDAFESFKGHHRLKILLMQQRAHNNKGSRGSLR